MNIDAGDTGKDSLLESFLNASSDFIEELIGGYVKQRDVEEILDGSGGEYLYPKSFPFLKLVGSSVPEQMDNFQWRSSYSAPWQNLFSDLKQFQVQQVGAAFKNAENVIVRIDGSVFPFGVANIRQFATFGFLVIPDTIKQCCSEMCEIMYKEAPGGNDDLGKSEKSTSVESQNRTTKLKSMTPRWLELLNPYIRQDLRKEKK